MELYEFNKSQKEKLQYQLMMHCHKTPHIWKFDNLIKVIETIVNEQATHNRIGD